MATPLDIEDLKIYFYDTFLSTDQFEEEIVGTGEILYKPADIKVSAGVTSLSSAFLNYKGIFANPHYGELIFKLRVNTKENVLAFWGFKESKNDPTYDMVESHCGFMIATVNNIPKIFLTSADGNTQQRVEVATIDPTLMYEYKIVYNKFYYKPLPQVISYLGLPTIKSVDRSWKLLQTNDIYPPEDKTHYIVVFIKNTAITEKYLRLNRIVYKEEYAD